MYTHTHRSFLSFSVSCFCFRYKLDLILRSGPGGRLLRGALSNHKGAKELVIVIATVPRWPPPNWHHLFCLFRIVWVFYTCACDIRISHCLLAMCPCIALREYISYGNPTQLYSLDAALKPYLKKRVYLYSLSLYVHTLLSNAHGVKILRRNTMKNCIVWWFLRWFCEWL